MGSVGCCCVQRCVDRFQIALAHWRFAAADVAAAVMMSAEQCSQLPHLLCLDVVLQQLTTTTTTSATTATKPSTQSVVVVGCPGTHSHSLTPALWCVFFISCYSAVVVAQRVLRLISRRRWWRWQPPITTGSLVLHHSFPYCLSLLCFSLLLLFVIVGQHGWYWVLFQFRGSQFSIRRR